MYCGLPGALSVISTEALRIPAAVGVKVTVIVHWTPGAKGEEERQVLVSAKSPASVPVMLMLVMVVVLSPLVSVTVCGALVVPRLWVGNTRPAGLRAIPCKMLTSEMKASQLPP